MYSSLKMSKLSKIIPNIIFLTNCSIEESLPCEVNLLGLDSREKTPWPLAQEFNSAELPNIVSHSFA